MMNKRTFIDTNILVYYDDKTAGVKQKKAQGLVADLISSSLAVVSTQVLQEYFAIATRKLKLSASLARERVELFATLEVVLLDSDLILGAIDLCRLHSLSFWDALIVRAAKVVGCTCILTEDLNHHQMIDGVRVENPFV